MFGEPAGAAARVGYMPQNRGAAPTARLTGYAVIASAAMGARFGFSRLDAATRREIDWALDQVGARELARRPIAELSGGERQRLLLSQALIGRPKLLLLDEPLISLDPAHQHAVVEIVARLRRELGIAVLFSAHELNPLVNAIDRVLYLGGGAAALGTVDEVVNSRDAVAALRRRGRGGAGARPGVRDGGRRRGRARGAPARGRASPPCAWLNSADA